MSEEIKPIIFTFGGGVNARNRSFDVDIDECVSGENFNLDVALKAMGKRPAFDLLATVPNAQPIRGYAQLVKRNGTITTLIQAGTTVYSWDTVTTFAEVGSVSGSSKLRGSLQQNWLLDEFVIITDLQRETTVKTWDGTTFQDYTHNLDGSFFAKYCRVQNERAVFGNVKVGTADTPHVLLASAIGDHEALSNEERPSSSLSEADSFYLPTLDLRPINGFETGFGEFILSTYRGSLYHLAGSSAKDFFVHPLYEQAAVAGDEAIVNIGNDLLLGLPGRVESLSGTIDFGDVEKNDISLWVAPLVRDVQSWTMAYDRNHQRVFCFPDNQAVCWTLHKSLLARPSSGVLAPESEQSSLSPWVKWTTTHAMAMQPTLVASIFTSAGDNMVLAGDQSGNLYRLDGTGALDGGTENVVLRRRSGVFRLPDKQLFDFKGWVNYTTEFASTLTLRFLWAGKGSPDRELSISLPGGDSIGVYGDDFYYNSSVYYGTTFSGRISRQDYYAPGSNSYCQIEIESAGTADLDLQEVGVIVRAA